MSDGVYARWEAVEALAPEAGAYDVLLAARSDLTRQRDELLAGREAALSFRKPSIQFRDRTDELVIEVQAAGGAVYVRLTPEVIRAAVDHRDTTPLDLLAAGLLARGTLERGWRPQRVGQAHAPGPETRAYYERMYRSTPASARVEGHLDAGNDVVVIGDPGSGKSALAAIVADRWLGAGGGMVWLNLTDPADGPESILGALLRHPANQRRHHLLVLENLHANLLILDEVFAVRARLRGEFGLTVQVLATSWKSAGALLRGSDPTRDLHQVQAEGRDLVRQLLADSGIGEADQRAIRLLAEEDAHIALTAIDLYGRDGRVPTEADLQEHYTRQVDAPGERRMLYVLSCLGVLELPLSTREAGQFGTVPQRLRGLDLIHQVDGAYQVGPRRRAKLVMNHARHHWDADRLWKRPEQIVWLHLQRGGERMMKAMLSRLDRLVSPGEARRDELYLLTTWDHLGQLGKWLRRQTANDRTWGGNLGAAVFAASALAQLNHVDSWRQIAEVVRDTWRYDDPDQDLPVPAGANTEDHQDFVEIKAAMAEEDALLGPAPHLAGLTAEDLDTDLMYRNWVLGLLLGFEGSAPPEAHDEQRITRLVEMAEQAAEDDGNFYPARVPWVTARVVLGLCQAGLRLDTPVVHKACQWLLRGVDEGGPLGGWWRSGTGTWNRAEATTAMCLSALTRAGVARNPSIETAYAWLIGREAEWTIPGREIDLAQVLEATLLCTESTTGTHEHLKTLFSRMKQELRGTRRLPGGPEERLRLPFVASQLADTLWQVVQMESLKLYGDVFNDSRPQTPVEPVPGAAPEPDGHHRGSTLTTRQLAEWQQGVEQIRQTIREQIAKRDGTIRTRAVVQVIERYQEFRAQIAALQRQLHADVDRDVLRQINELGRDVCGAAWYPPWPFDTTGDDPDDEPDGDR
ncbi:ATP-binding protein [Micromonospora humida]|uniref:ATP-binding protein n=1 Tax=Micromonospora humida TaxID=2809018 RepID=UPI00344A2F11